MYSSASVTDLDSDDYEYPNYDCDVDDNSNSSCNKSVQKSQSCRVHQFGEFEENYGWIQCPSKSYPDRVYYHNTRSGCHTWYRPISRYVDIPFVSIRRVSRLNSEKKDAKLCVPYSFYNFSYLCYTVREIISRIWKSDIINRCSVL